MSKELDQAISVHNALNEELNTVKRLNENGLSLHNALYLIRKEIDSYRDSTEEMNSMQSRELETLYFSVVDTYDDLTGEPILVQKEMLLDEDTYRKFVDNDDSDPVFINWSELYEVVRLEDNVYMLVNYTDMDGVEHKNVFSRFRTNTVGPVEEFVGWLD